ncbi:MAG: GGDEF domain-containing protein [Firmicutes bacterium]|nr:GGDEF domain-containing protein [Bacillota bacterium]
MFSNFFNNSSKENLLHKIINLVPSSFLNSRNPLNDVYNYLRNNHWVAVIYMDIVHFQTFEQNYGQAFCTSILKQLESMSKKSAPQFLSPYKTILCNRWGDDICVFFTGDSPPSLSELHKLSHDFCNEISYLISCYLKKNAKMHGISVQETIEFHIGYSIISPNNYDTDKSLYNALKECFLIAKNNYDIKELETIEELKGMIEQKKFHIVYQPIVSLKNGKIMGYEALTRGPKGSVLESPGVLFPFAEKVGLLYPLEKVTREKALEEMYRLKNGQKLFININPAIVNDSSFSAGNTKKLLESIKRLPHNVVFELTERNSITDFHAFRSALEHYRHQGFQVAVDDAGSGYSSLQSVAELRPDYIKIDRSLIKNIHQDPIKEALVETFVTFSKKINSILIGEGIETEEELKTIMKLGVDYVQGFYLAKPNNPLPNISSQSINVITTGIGRPNQINTSTPVYEVVQNVPGIQASTVTDAVVNLFNNNSNLSNVVVLDGDKPVGLIMRNKLFNKLGSQYGYALYCKREVKHVMDCQPLIVEGSIIIEKVAQLAMQRNADQVYDAVIVTDNDNYSGIISIQRILDVITHKKMEVARVSNPLTNLPGNPVIDAELTKRIKMNDTFTIIYADLDNFKSLNDRYGFERGDAVIKMTSKILTCISSRYGTIEDMVGHIGGDDFIIVTTENHAENMCTEIIDAFSKTIPHYYDKDDRDNGFIVSNNRQGNKEYIPIISISLAVLYCEKDQFKNLDELSRVAARIKKKAKSINGNISVSSNSP